MRPRPVAASVKLMYQPQPTPEAIKAFKDASVVNFACGHNHVVALDDQKRAWSWGEPPCHDAKPVCDPVQPALPPCKTLHISGMRARFRASKRLRLGASVALCCEAVQ